MIHICDTKNSNMKIILCKHDSSGPVTLEMSEKEFEALKHYLSLGIQEEIVINDEHFERAHKMKEQMNRITFN